MAGTINQTTSTTEPVVWRRW